MLRWTGPIKQAVVAVVSLSLIHATIPQSANPLPPSHLDRVGQYSPLAFGLPGKPKDVATKSDTIQLKPKLSVSSVNVVNGRKSNLAKPLTPPSNDQKPPIIRPVRPDSLTIGSGRTDATAVGPHGLSFVENKGQWDEQARFQLRSSGKTLWLTNGGIVFDNVRAKAKEPPDPALGLKSPPLSPAHQLPDNYERNVFYEDFVNPRSVPVIEQIDIQPGAYNYLVGSDSTKWHTAARAFAGVVYRNVWDGVDFKVAKNGANIEQEFVVHPGADLSRVQVAYRGIDRLEVAGDGSLLIRTTAGEMRETAPKLYQEIAGRPIPVEGRFKLLSGTSYTFEVPTYNDQYALVIDPTLLYSTYLGGSAGNNSYTSGEVATGIAVDTAGDAYVTGYTLSADFPTTSGALQTSAVPSAWNSFVTKLNPAGTGLIYSTYLNGTSGHTFSNAIAVDRNGNAYVTGYTSFAGGFPTTPNAYAAQCNSGDFFLMELSPNGDQLVYSSCLNVSSDVAYGALYGYYPSAIAVDSHGRAYIAGGASPSTGNNTGAQGIPITPNAYESQYPNMPASAFVTVFDTTASGAASLFYSTYLGVPSGSGTGAAIASGIAVDSFGKVYVTGGAPPGFPVTPGAYQTTYAPCIPNGILCPASSISFLAKLDPSVSGSQSLIYSTYFGGMGQTTTNAIAIDSTGAAYVTGSTSGSYYNSFPITPGAFQSNVGQNSGANFVTKFNPAGSNLVYSTFVSGNSPSYGNGIAVDSLGNAYIAGNFRAGGVSNPFFPVTADAFQSSFTKLSGDFSEAFLTKLNPDGSGLVYSTYLGGDGDDVATAVAIDQVGDAYVTGHTSSATFPVTPGAFQPVRNGTGDVFVTKFPLGAVSAFSISSIAPTTGGNVGTVTVRVVGGGFHSGATVKLFGPATIIGSSPFVGSEGRTIDVPFDLTGAPPGAYSLSVVNPDGTSISLANAFSVQQGGGSDLSVSIVGRNSIVIEQGSASTTFNVVVSNRGNTDALGVVVSLYGIPSNANLTPFFAVSPPPVNPSGFSADFSGTPFATVLGEEQIPDVLLPLVPAGGSIVLPFGLAITSLPPLRPLLPLPPGNPVPFPPFPVINVTALLTEIDFFCNDGCFSTILKSVPGLGDAVSCITGIICTYLKTALLTISQYRNRGTVLSLTQVVAQAILDCVPLGKIVDALKAGKTVIDLWENCIKKKIPVTAVLSIKASLDPNDKEGIAGIGPAGWIKGNDQLFYSIYFLNEPTATAAARNVVITDVLDASIDLATFTVDGIIIGGRNIPLSPPIAPNLGQYQAGSAVDLRPAQSLILNANVSLNPATRTLSWQFAAIDPTTGLPPSDPAVGILPQGVEGSLAYSAKPLRTVATGTIISNQATVVFDGNAAMNTPTWGNTIDNTAPTSQVGALLATEPLSGFTVNWSGTDIGSGIQDFTIYASDNGGPFMAWQQNTTSTSATFTGQLGHTYGFYSIARDLVGNVEVKSSVAEATTSVPTNLAPAFTSPTTATFQVGVAGSLAVLTTGFPVSSIAEAGTLPSGVAFVDNGNGTATLGGTPATGTAGSYTIALTAQNGISPNALQTLTLLVDQVPAITSAAIAVFQTGTASSFTINTSGFPSAAITESGALPTGVTFVNNGSGTATISGTATVGGVFNITITAANGVTPNAVQSFTLTVNQAPTFTNANSATFLVGTPGSFTVSTSAFPIPSLTETGGLPAGVAFVSNGNGTGTLAGTPTASGVYTITLSASSSSGVSTQAFTLIVNQTPSITSVNSATLLVGSASSFSVTSVGFPAASLTETGTLPGGLTFTNNGNGTATLAGTPSASGVFSVSLTATNSVGAATQGFTLTVDQTPAFGSANSATFQAGAANSFTVAAAGFPTPALVGTGALPAGVMFIDNHNGTGTLSGTPTASGSFNITLTASNTVGAVTQSFALTVTGVVSQVSISPASINFGDVYLLSLQSKKVTIQNVGASAISMGKPSISFGLGTDKDYFTLANSCGTSLAAGSSCTVTVVYLADDVETSSATLNITDGAAGSPQQVSLTANVINPIAGFNRLVLNFGTLKVGTSATKAVTLTNIGTTALNITAISVTGANVADFTATPTCPTSLAPKASCTISVKFAPGAKGDRSAGLTFTDNARTHTQIIPLVGEGN
jgi:hypothetical protein